MERTLTLVEAGDRWGLPLDGRQVERVCIDFAVTLLFTGALELRIERPFVITRSDGSDALVVPAAEPERLAPVLEVARGDVTRAEAFKDGHLELSFSDGMSLVVPFDEGFEAWELVGPGGLRAVSLPGGDLAVSQPDPAS